MENQEIPPSPFDERASHRTLALEVEGRKFWVPRDTMAVHSPAFERMLYGDYHQANKDLIPLPGKKAKDMEEVLRCFIPIPTCKEIDRSNLELVLEFSDEYQIAELRQKAEVYSASVVEKCPIGGGDLLYILPIAAKRRLKVFEQCLKRCVEELDLASLLPVFNHVPDQIKCLFGSGQFSLPCGTFWSSQVERFRVLSGILQGP